MNQRRFFLAAVVMRWNPGLAPLPPEKDRLERDFRLTLWLDTASRRTEGGVPFAALGVAFFLFGLRNNRREEVLGFGDFCRFLSNSILLAQQLMPLISARRQFPETTFSPPDACHRVRWKPRERTTGRERRVPRKDNL